jgi:predicted nucleic acid-binding protein
LIVLVDTTIWSLALRRRPQTLSEDEKRLVLEWKRLVESGEAVLIGPIRQEILSGIREEKTFEAIRESLGDFRYLEIRPKDYDQAARFYNRCRAHGVTGTSIDLLLCAVAHRFGIPLFTTDPDFGHYAPHTGNRLHQPAAI